MKKPLRLMAALLAFCVLAAVFPPVGLAAEEGGFFDLRAAVEQAQPGATITLPGNAEVNAGVRSSPWIIQKNVTIDGQGHSATIRAIGILLGADVTFRNVDLNLAGSDGRNAVIANGNHLTLDNVTAGGYSINVFGGSLTPSSYEDYFSVPSPGTAKKVTIQGSTNLQGRNSGFGAGNIYAGSLSMGGLDQNSNGPDDNGPPTDFPGDVTIEVEGSIGSNLGTIYAGGAQNRIPVGAISGKVTIPDPDKYKVIGTVTITGGNAIPSVNGEGATAAEMTYTGNGNEDTKTLEGISSLSVEGGNLVLANDSWFPNAGTLSLASGAKLNLSKFQDPIPDFHGNGGLLILGTGQTLMINGQVMGTTKVAIGGTTSGDSASSSAATSGHPYIMAPNSTDGNFQLLPYAMQPNMTLVRDDSGNWTATNSSSGGDEDLVQDFSFDTTAVTAKAGEDVIFPLTVTGTTSAPTYLDYIPLNINVNGYACNRTSSEQAGETIYTYTSRYGELTMEITANDLVVSIDPLCSPDTYTIRIIIPREYAAGGKSLFKDATLTVTDGGGAPDPGLTSIPVPKANTGLKWTGAEQTGVEPGAGYTLSGTHKAAGVGEYTATATLESGYQWTGGSQTPKSISWSIARADGPAAPTGLRGVAPTAAGSPDGKITGTTAAMEYASNTAFTGAQTCGAPETTGLAAGTYYVRVKETGTHEAGAHTSITVPAPGAPTVTGISVSSAAHKTEYQVGDELDVTGLTIEVAYSDGTRQTVPVTADMVNGFSSAQAVQSQILTITYEGHTAAYTVKITAAEQPGGTKYQVTVSNTGDGGTAAGTYAYEAGTSVTIRAGSKDALTFSAWETQGVTLSDPNSPEATFQMPAGNVGLHAIWTSSAEHTHVWDAAWRASGTHHWHDCSASGCPITDNSQKGGYAAHTAGDWVVDRPATSSQSGTRHKSCTVCGYELLRETIPATGGGSSGGGSSGGSSSGGSSSGTTTTVKNPDGSTTATNNNKTTGTVTETTRRPDGSKTVVETKKDGTVTITDTAKDGSTVKTVARPDGTSETRVEQADGLTASVWENRSGATADIRLSAKSLQESQNGSVVLPIPPLPGDNASVTFRTGSARPVPVEIPVHGNDFTTVACLVNEDGSETIFKTAVLTGGQITLPVPDGATVRIRDNRKDFSDTRGHWASTSIDFVAARELFSGKTSTSFAPDAPMSRAMLAAVLARLDGVDASGGAAYEKGMAWAVSQGISDGRNPEGQVTREQFVAMLHRYAGSPAATDRELHFSDAEAVSAYAREAVRWAVENGILSGYQDGSFAPRGKTTRAHTAAMLARYVEFLNRQ